MATIVLSREGGFLKFVDGALIKYYNLNDIVAMIKDGTKVTWCDGRAYDYTDILSPVFSSAEQFADQIGIWKAEAQAGSGTFAIPHVVNFSALPPPATVPNQYYFCDNSEGTKWLPGTIGGTYYNAGLYRSDGTQWLTAENPYQATLAQVNAGVNDTNFVTPFTFSNSDKIVNSFQKNVDTSDQITEGSIQQFVPTYPNDPTLFLNGQRQWVNVAGTSELIVVTNRPPNANDDVTQNNFIGQRWIDTSGTLNNVYICRLNTTGLAEWEFINNPTFFRYNNVKVVQTLADFPAPVGTEIQLEDKTYLIDALKLDMTGYTLVFGTRSAIQGFNQNVSSLQWKGNGDLCFKSTTNLFINDLEVYLSAPNITLYDHQGDGTTPEGESFEIERMACFCQDDLGNFQLGCKAGTIKDIRQGFMSTQFFLGFADGFKFAGTWTNGGMRITDTLWRAFAIAGQTGKVYYSDPLDPVTFDSRFSSNANIQVNGSSVGYDFPQAAFTFDGQYQLQNGNVSGSGTYVSLWSGLHPSTYPEANFKNNSGIKNTFPGVEWISDTDNLVTIAAQNVWYKIPIATATVKEATWVSYANGEITYNSDNALDGSIITRISAVGKSNDIVQVKIVKEDALAVQEDLIIATITIQGSAAQGRAENVTIPTTAEVSKDDKLSVYVRNTSGTTDVTILDGANFILGQK